jgi:peptidase E
MKKQIIALGGGGFSQEPDNPLLDLYILDQAGKPKPEICFLPTAGRDPEDYIERFYKVYERLPCTPSHISLVRNPVSAGLLESVIMSKDIIFAGGGSTRILMAQWKKWNLDRILKKAYESGIIMSGMSAGGICWFNDGIFNPTDKKLMRLQCLGFINGSFCPHYDERTELRSGFKSLIRSEEIETGYGAEDGAAVHFINDKFYKAVSSRENAKIFSVKFNGRRVTERRIKTEFLGKYIMRNKPDSSDDLTVAFINEFINYINDHKIDKLIEFIGDETVFKDSLGIYVDGKSEIKKAWNTLFSLFPDYTIKVDEIVNKKDTIGIFGTASGTYLNNNELSGVDSFRIPASWKVVVKNNRIIEWQVYADNEPVRNIIKKNLYKS